MTDSANPAMEIPPPPPMAANRLDQALPRRRFFTDMPDKGLFGLVALAGFTAICTLKLYGFNADYVAGFAVVLMIAYGTIAYRIPQVQMRIDRLGDNFYYLGFIWRHRGADLCCGDRRSGPLFLFEASGCPFWFDTKKISVRGD
jgi:hypothetical protein